MSPNLLAFLKEASECAPEKGMAITTEKERKAAGTCVSRGWGEIWSAAGLSVFIISKKGREAYAQEQRGK